MQSGHLIGLFSSPINVRLTGFVEAIFAEDFIFKVPQVLFGYFTV